MRPLILIHHPHDVPVINERVAPVSLESAI